MQQTGNETTKCHSEHSKEKTKNLKCSVEKSFRASRRQVEKSLDMARDGFCFLIDFSTSPPFLSSTEDTGASVEMTMGLFHKANSKLWGPFVPTSRDSE
jgi:hypothetical protein